MLSNILSLDLPWSSDDYDFFLQVIKTIEVMLMF